MKGNFHVRFLEGGGLATARPYSVKAIRALGVKEPPPTSLVNRDSTPRWAWCLDVQCDVGELLKMFVAEKL
jgi:hypothetical protein